MEGFHIWHNDCLWYADFNEGFRSPICLRSQRTTRSNVRKISRVKSALKIVTRTLDRWCPYLAQSLSIVCK